MELAKLVGEENAIMMYREYRGFQLNNADATCLFSAYPTYCGDRI